MFTVSPPPPADKTMLFSPSNTVKPVGTGVRQKERVGVSVTIPTTRVNAEAAKALRQHKARRELATGVRERWMDDGGLT